jgi:GT2 family glycosyltransferase
MTVRNLAPYISTSVESILAQTYSDFEFVIRDDGSDDGTTDILRAFARRDPRIRLFEAESSLGPSGSSNWIAARARGDLVARMDGDDWSHPDRLRRQVALLDSAPEAVLVGTLGETMNEEGKLVRRAERWRLVATSSFAPFPHGSVMYRREAFEAVGGYRASAEFWEDLDLYRRIFRHGKLLVVAEPLYRHRATRLSTRLVSERAAVEASVDRMYRAVSRAHPPARRGRVAPRVFLSLGSTELWAGGRAAVLTPVLRRADLRLDRDSVLVLAWAVWATLSPATLRLCLRGIGRVRDLTAARRLPAGKVHLWEPRGGDEGVVPLSPRWRPRPREQEVPPLRQRG